MSLKTPKIETFFANCVKYKKANNNNMNLPVYSVRLTLPPMYYEADNRIWKTSFTQNDLIHIAACLYSQHGIELYYKGEGEGLTPINGLRNTYQVDLVANHDSYAKHIHKKRYGKRGPLLGLIKQHEIFKIKYKGTIIVVLLTHFEEIRHI